ncbi:MAG TPA: DDE-type integrase/transposase/recombinase, partial [Candidatus Babeliaceae bacterium]|nr:DDE-type integrase/transposase/recombinase [Candidatus Babeliaceae bacterium]
VNGSLPSSPLPGDPLNLEGKREAKASVINSSISVNSNANDNDNASSTSSALSASSASSLLIEVEKKGKICPDSIEKRKALVSSAHHFGHFGRDAMFKQLWSKGYWWPSIRADIEDELRNCDPCTRFTVVKAGFHPASYITANGPGDHIQVDTSVHLPESPDGYTALLACIDVFSGFIILRPVKNTTAETIARELWEIFAIIGIPKILQSDNGSEFANDILTALVRITGIEHRFISPYNPRADGKVERSIGTVMSIIKKMLHGTESHWPIFVSFAQLSFNNKISSLTGSSPFSLMFGRSLNDLKDYSNDPPNMIPIGDWKEHQEKIVSLIYPAISDRIKSGKDKLMKTLNSNRRLLLSSSFPVGSTVMIIDPHRQNKFEPKYIGPYFITRRSHGGAYVLKYPNGDILDRKVPPDQIKLISKSKRDIDSSRPIYFVEKILKHRGSPENYEYLVKWKDFTDEENTWEPATSFLDHNIIRDYWKSINQPTSSP